MKFFLLLISLFVYVVFLIISYLIAINFFYVDVVFYTSIYCVLISAVFFSILIYFTKIYKIYSSFEKFQILLLCLSCGYAIAISVPTVIDRSLSFYILEKLNQRGGGVQLSKFNYIFTQEYMREHKLVDVRLTEQSVSGTIFIDHKNDCVRITEKGIMLAHFSRLFRKYFLPKKRLLLNEYTDILLDPFSRSDENPDYLCNHN